MRYYKTLPECYEEELREIINDHAVLSFEEEKFQNRIAIELACNYLDSNNIQGIYIKNIDLYNSYNITGGTINYKVIDNHNFLLSIGVYPELLEKVKDIELALESDFDTNNFNYYRLCIDGSIDLDIVSESELDFICDRLNKFNYDFQESVSKYVDDIMVQASELAIDDFIENEIVYYTYDIEDGLDFHMTDTEDYQNFLYEVELAKKQLAVNRLNRQLNNKSNIVKKVNKI